MNKLIMLAIVSLAGCSAEKDYSHCIPASDIAKVLGNVVVDSAMAVRSNDFKKVYFIAARIKGHEDSIGVWASNSLTPGKGMVWSVGEVAKLNSPFPASDKIRSPIYLTDHGAFQSKGCLIKLN